MATQRLTMKNIREILRQKLALQRSRRDVALSLDVSPGVVGPHLGHREGPERRPPLWPDADQTSGPAPRKRHPCGHCGRVAATTEELERVIYDGEPAAAKERPLPDLPYIHTERRRQGVTLALRTDRMMNQQTMDKLRELKLNGLAAAWIDQQAQTDYAGLGFDERFGLLVDAEWMSRQNEYDPRREIDKTLIRQIATCSWVTQHQNIAITGPTGTGKSFLAATIMTSQRPTELWHDHIGEPTLADAICDRMLSRCHRVMLRGPSRRKEVDSQT